MSNDIDLAAEFADDSVPEGLNVLPPLSELYGSDALPEDIDLESMLSVAMDPATPAPEGDLIPVDDAPLADDPFAAEDVDGDHDAQPHFHDDHADGFFHDHSDDPSDHLTGGMDDGMDSAADDIDDIDPGV